MIDWSAILVVVILLAALAAFVGSAFLLAKGAFLIREGHKKGHFLYWPGGLLLGTILAGAVALAFTEINAPTFVLIAAMMSGVMLAVGRFATRD